MKTPKEIQLATLTFLRAFKDQKASELEGTFIPFDPVFLYKQYQVYLGGTILFTVLFLFLLYNAWFIDAIYYWHIDFPVILGFLVIGFFLVVSIVLANKTIKTNREIQFVLKNPNKAPYGVLITEEYYFENAPNAHHIIPRENIIKIDYEELNPNNEIYLELLLDTGNHYEVRGITYKAEEYDLKSWIKATNS
ncbi:hypothetical protein [Aureispira anguillae]|uniref:Uncharacterized protein n=1 Tax=Aureispira anguillae TaxID=2864201 RepID=A0A915YGU9_9BACT|nr:hypothetical protein [Aureispira anguillae]BDS12917.1 hypothetical protein AsAng_0036420 [Aureispira anguillae]